MRITIQVILQSSVDPNMQARVFSLLSSLAGGMAPLGLIIAGPISDGMGIQTWFLLGGVLSILMAVAGSLIPALANIEEKRDENTYSNHPRP
jgi:DHA3 family macrolide efflux protein-like MFS transporter